MKKNLLSLFSVFCIASISMGQNYGVVFIPGLGGSPEEFKSGYDHVKLKSDLISVLNISKADFIYIDHDLPNGTRTNLSVTNRAEQVCAKMKTVDLNKQWFFIGYSTGGVVAKIFANTQNSSYPNLFVPNLKIKGVITIASPLGGMQNLSGGVNLAKAKWAGYYKELRTGPDGGNPIYADDVLQLDVAAIKSFLSVINDGFNTQLDSYFSETREDIKSLQKRADCGYPTSGYSNPLVYKHIGGEDYKFATIRAGGSLPSYLTAGTLQVVYDPATNTSSFVNFWSNPGVLISLVKNQDGMENFRADFNQGPLNAVGNMEATKSYFHYKRNKYNDVANYWNQGYWLGLFKSRVKAARAARDRYAVSRDAVDKFDWVSQDLSNDLKYTYETIIVEYREIDENWLKTCGDIYFGGGTPESTADVGFNISNYNNLPSLLAADLCSSPIYSRIWNETVIRVTSVKTVATDGVVSVPNQQGDVGGAYFKPLNTNPNDGHNHASSLYVVKPWNGEETATMREAKQWIGANR